LTVTLHGADSLDVGEVGGGQRLVERLRLRGDPGFEAKLKVSGAHADRLTVVANRETLDGSGRYALTARGRRIDLGLILEAPTDAGPIDCTLTFGWPDGDATAAFAGEVVCFAVDHASLDFGEVVVGETEPRMLEVRNRCATPIEVELRAPAAPFACASAGTLSLDPLEQRVVPVELSPTASGPVEGSLKVARGTQVLGVALRGEGRDPFEEAADVSETDDDEQTASELDADGSYYIGDFQRLYFHVPTKNTNVSLGKEYDADEHDPTHAGFSATTEGHVLLRNRVEGSTMTFQSVAQQWYQSTTKDLFLGSGDDGFTFVAGGGVYLSSGKGVVIAAGHGDMGDMNEFDSGADPPVPAIKSIGEALSQVALGWKIAGMLMGGVGVAYTGTRLALTAINKTFNGKWIEPLTAFMTVPILGLVKTGVMTALSVYGTINKEAGLNLDPALPSPTMNLYSEGGFLGGTFGYTAVYGGTGATFRSINAGVLGLVNASLDSLVATGMYGFRSAGLSSLFSTTIESGLKTMIKTPNGNLDIKGTKIGLSTKAGMLVKAGGGVNLAAPTMTTQAGPIFGMQGKQVQATAVATQMIAVAGKYGIEITPAGLTVGNLAGKAVDPSLPHLKIGPAGVTVMGGPAGPSQLKITPAGVTLQGPGNDLRHMGMTLFSRATRVELC